MNKFAKFQVGDRVRLVDTLPRRDDSHVWIPGNTAVVVNVEARGRGYAGPELGLVTGPTYGVRFDGFESYSSPDDHHTAAEVVLEHEVSDDEIMEAIRSIGKALP